MRQSFWKLILRSPSILIGGTLVLMVVLSAIFASQLAPFDPIAFNTEDRLQNPNWQHWFGTDIYGRDTFSRVLYGARQSLAVAFLSVSLALLVGGVAGSLAGFYRGWVDTIIMRFTDILLAFPAILLDRKSVV